MGIRAFDEGDLEAACQLLEEAFGRPDEARLLRELRETDALAVALVNEVDDAVAAIAVLSHLPSPAGCLGLGPLAVTRDRRDRGLGKALIGESVDWARRAGHAAIFVLGQPRYYQRFGFSVEAAAPFASPYPAEYMMALELRPGALERALADSRDIRYPPAFAAL